MIPLALALLAAAPMNVTVAQVSVTQSLIIRIPAKRTARGGRRTPIPPPPPQTYREKKGPHCIDAAAIGGAAITAPDAVDFILKGGKRARARLEEECPALDYYSGFYVTPPADGRICAGRDSIHTRSGGDCQIDKIRILTPIAAP
jgi:hypothetical protein